MTDIAQLEILEGRAEAVDNELDADAAAPSPEAAAPVVLPPIEQELADMLDLVAMAGSFLLPTMKDRFNHAANLQIATAAVKLADHYHYDIRGALLGENSVILLWVGLGYSLAIPAAGTIADYKAMKAQAAAERRKAEQAANGQPRPQPEAQEGVMNAVATGV